VRLPIPPNQHINENRLQEFLISQAEGLSKNDCFGTPLMF